MKFIVFFIFLLFCTISLNAFSVNSLHSFQTKHFQFVFSESSREAAYFTSSFAESYYIELSKMYNSSTKDKITVIFINNNEISNGISYPLGYPVILIYTIPPNPDSSIGNNKNWLHMVFVHELSHIFFLNMKTPFIHAISNIFGNFFLRNSLLPKFMIKGIAVFDESKEGFGRIYDPLITEKILQDSA